MRSLRPTSRAQGAPRTRKPLPRKIHFSEQEVWSYRVGWFILIREPDNEKTHRIGIVDFVGYDVDEEDGSYDVMPSDIRRYIANVLKATTPFPIPNVVYQRTPYEVWGTWKGPLPHRWHLFATCAMQTSAGANFPAPRREAEAYFEEALTLGNLCGACRNRYFREHNG